MPVRIITHFSLLLPTISIILPRVGSYDLDSSGSRFDLVFQTSGIRRLEKTWADGFLDRPSELYKQRRSLRKAGVSQMCPGRICDSVQRRSTARRSAAPISGPAVLVVLGSGGGMAQHHG
ncbi:MAG: hypothetical protein WCO77_13665, partial [bacterium]